MSKVLYTLAYSTTHPKINQILQGVIGVFEQVFPQRIRGYYLRGSHCSGNAVPNSDLDLYVIFKEDFRDAVESIKAAYVAEFCAFMSPMLLEIAPGAENSLTLPETTGITLNFKLSTQFLYGEDIRDKIPMPSTDAWVRWAMHAPLTSLLAIRCDAEFLTFPLEYPDPQAEFLGYEHQTIPHADGIERPSTKWLIATVGWIATALVAQRTGQYVGSKREAIELYKTYINDEWTNLIEQVYEKCRNSWHYLIPDEQTERQTLRALCQEALGFSNYFLSRYRRRSS